MTRSTNLPRTRRRAHRGAAPGRAGAVAALAVAAALTLGGCADAETPGAGASTEASESPSATSSPTPTPEAVATTPAETDPETGAETETGTNTIATPATGSTVAGPQVEVTGAGTAFEGNLTWRVVTAGTDDVVTEGFTTGGANGTIGPFAFTVELAPGSYTVEIWEPDMSDGEGEGSDDAPRGLVTSTFTVS